MTTVENVYVHETAVVDPGARIGPGTKVWHFVHVAGDAVIGDECVLGQNVFIADGVRLGNRVRVQNNVSVYRGVVVADDVFLGPSCVFTNVINPRAFVSRKDEFRPTRVECGVTVGANATILCGHTLGAYAFVAAGAVVTKDVPPFALVLGTPARRVGWMCRCGERLPDGTALTCPSCGAGYEVQGERCEPKAPS